MTDKLILRNLERRLVSYELPHAEACTADSCTCSLQLVGWRDHDGTTGERFVRGVRKLVGASLHLLAAGTPGGGDEIEAPLGALRVTAIKTAVMRGLLKADIEKAPEFTGGDSAPVTLAIAPAPKAPESKPKPAATPVIPVASTEVRAMPEEK